MSNLSARTTIYLNPYVKKFLQLRAVQESRSVSELVNERFEKILKEFEELKALEKRRGEPVIEWDTIKSELDKKHGLL
jgi:hypothetical protein